MRLGANFQTVTCDFEKVFQISDKLFVGLTGLASDVLSVEQLLQFKCNIYKLKENRAIKPAAFSAMLSSLLYEKRFGPWFTEPIVAGLTEDDQPFLSGMDLIGAPVFTSEFVVSGTCTPNLHGMCEALYRPDMVRPFAYPSSCFSRVCMKGTGGTVRGALAVPALGRGQRRAQRLGRRRAHHVSAPLCCHSRSPLLPRTPEGVHTRKLKCRQD